ncbi:MAG: ribonuclease HI family protein [Chloroflexota bacterium]
MSNEFGMLIIYADGAIGGSTAGAGAVVQDRRGQVLALANRTLPRMTNNEAEYAGLLLGLEMALRLAAGTHTVQIEVRLDSEIVVYQMSGRFAVNSAALKRLHREACQRARNMTNLSYRHIPREANRIADALAGEAAAGRLWWLEKEDKT